MFQHFFDHLLASSSRMGTDPGPASDRSSPQPPSPFPPLPSLTHLISDVRDVRASFSRGNRIGEGDLLETVVAGGNAYLPPVAHFLENPRHAAKHPAERWVGGTTAHHAVPTPERSSVVPTPMTVLRRCACSRANTRHLFVDIGRGGHLFGAAFGPRYRSMYCWKLLTAIRLPFRNTCEWKP